MFRFSSNTIVIIWMLDKIGYQKYEPNHMRLSRYQSVQHKSKHSAVITYAIALHYNNMNTKISTDLYRLIITILKHLTKYNIFYLRITFGTVYMKFFSCESILLCSNNVWYFFCVICLLRNTSIHKSTLFSIKLSCK